MKQNKRLWTKKGVVYHKLISNNVWKRWGMPPKQVLNPKWVRIWGYGPLMDGSPKQNKDLVFWALILVLKKPKNKSKNLPQIDDPGMQRLSEKKFNENTRNQGYNKYWRTAQHW
jgi:hypothetical protein